jgi:hypothetical protein
VPIRSRQSTFGSLFEGLVEFVPSGFQMLPVPPHASGQPLLEIMRGGVAEKMSSGSDRENRKRVVFWAKVLCIRYWGSSISPFFICVMLFGFLLSVCRPLTVVCGLSRGRYSLSRMCASNHSGTRSTFRESCLSGDTSARRVMVSELSKM